MNKYGSVSSIKCGGGNDVVMYEANNILGRRMNREWDDHGTNQMLEEIMNEECRAYIKWEHKEIYIHKKATVQV